MKKYFFILLFVTKFLFPGCKDKDNNRDKMILSAKKVMGYGHAPNSFTYLSFFDEKGSSSPWSGIHAELKNIPDTLKNIRVSLNPTCWGQFVYQNYKQGTLPTDFFRELENDWQLDTSKLTASEIHCFFTVVLGENDNGQMFYIIDRDNDLDLKNDSVKPLKKTYKPFFPDMGKIESSDIDKFFYEYYNGKEVKRDSSWVYIFRDHFGRPSFVIFEHREADLKVRDREYRIEIKAPVNTPDYSSYTKIAKLTDGLSTIPEKYWLSPGEYLIIEDSLYFRIDRININGDSLFMTWDREAELKGGSQIGMKALDFTAVSLDGKEIRLSDYRGKYIILDFWGTWCAPCVSFLETLKEIHNTYIDKNLVILGIANDKLASLKKFLQQHPLPWPQISQYRPDHDSLLNLYKITGYPTTFLIDTSGKIVSKHSQNDLKEKLRELLLSPEEFREKYLSGNTHFELDGFEYADFVKARVYSPTAKGRDVNMVRINGKWQGSIDLEPGDYTYEFIVDNNRIPDPSIQERKLTDQKDREVTVLHISGDSKNAED